MRQKKTLSLGFLLGSLLLLIGCSTIYVYPSNLINTDDAKKTIERLILSQPADHVDNPVKKVEVSSEQIQIFSPIVYRAG